MLSLGNSLSKKTGVVAPGVIRDNLVMEHKYPVGAVQPLSDGAAYFNGSSEIATTCPGSNLEDAVTVSAWIKILDDHNSYRSILGISDGSHDLWDFQIIASSSGSAPNTPSLAQGGDSGATDWTTAVASQALAADGWMHLAVTTIDGAQVIYKNGAVLALQTGGTRSEGLDFSGNVHIGSVDGTHYFRGWMCNVGLWTRVLTQAEIKSVMWKQYADLSTSEKTNITAWWNLDAQVGSDGNAGTGYVLDENAGAGSTTNLGTL